MRVKRIAVWIVVSAFLITVAGLGLEGVWAQTEQPLTASVTTSSSATLLAKGAAVQVPVVYSCVAASGITVESGFVSIRLDQVVKKVVNRSFGSLPIAPVCDGAQHTVILTVYSDNGIPFRKGVALVSAHLSVFGRDPTGGEYGGFVSADASSTTEVKIQ
jgi:hypothetical protein